MRALAGPALLLVVVGGYAVHRLTSAPESPTREFMELELAGADEERSGTCYSLDTVLVAYTAFSDAVLTWKPYDERTWTLTLEGMGNGMHGAEHWFQHLTFRQEDAQVRLIYVKSSQPPRERNVIKATLDDLLEAPHSRRSTPVDRCREPGATGYLFKGK